MKKTGLVITLAAVLSCGGCAIIGIMSEPGAYEKKISPEYDFAAHAKQRTLILVNQPGWINAQVNLRYYLTEAIIKNICENLKFSSANFISYDELSNYRSNQPDFALLSPVEAGKALHADVVLAVTIEDYQLTELGETGYYKAHLYAQAVLLNAADDAKLWPAEDSRTVKVGFEAEGQNKETAVKRLVNDCVHCITRYLYPCDRDNFKIADDMSKIDWENWGPSN